MTTVELFGQKFERVTAEEVKQMTMELYSMVKRSGFYPDCIVTPTRGGLFPSRYYSDYSNVHTLYIVGVEFYTDINKTVKEPRITQGLLSNVLEGKKVMVVDDVADTGKSLTTTVDYIKGMNPGEVKVGVLYLKPWSSFTPDYHVRETDVWIIFDCEQRETIENLLKQDSIRHLPPSEIRKGLEVLKFDKNVVDLVFRERNWIFSE